MDTVIRVEILDEVVFHIALLPTQPYFILQVLEDGDWGPIMLK